jgi:hypothetical protein
MNECLYILLSNLTSRILLRMNAVTGVKAKEWEVGATFSWPRERPVMAVCKETGHVFFMFDILGNEQNRILLYDENGLFVRTIIVAQSPLRQCITDSMSVKCHLTNGQLACRFMLVQTVLLQLNPNNQWITERRISTVDYLTPNAAHAQVTMNKNVI